MRRTSQPTLSAELHLLARCLARTADLPGPRAVAAPGAVDWERWWALVCEHRLGAHLAASRARLADVAVPDEIASELSRSYLRAAHRATCRIPETEQLIAAIAAEPPPILLKGGALIGRLYAEAARREMDDIDLLLRSPRHIERARELLIRRGYLEWGTPRPGHHALAFFHPVLELGVDLHRDLLNPGVGTEALATIWARCTRVDGDGGAPVSILDPVTAVAHHGLHALADPVESPLVRNLFELAWMYERLDRADRARTSRLAADWGSGRRFTLALALASDLFGTPAPPQRPRRDALALWCRRRLEWFHDGSRPSRRFHYDVAARHLERAADRSRPGQVIAFGAAVTDSLWRSAVRRARAGRPALGARLVRAPATSARVGACALVHAHLDGSVHMLGEEATAVWELLSDPIRAGVLLSRLAAAGVPRQAVRRALHTLRQLGLVTTA